MKKDNPHVFDVRENRWGHAITGSWKLEDGLYKIMGVLTPLPEDGDYIIANKGHVTQVFDVEHHRNPPDLFVAKARSLGVAFNDVAFKDGIPTVEQIQEAQKSLQS